MGNNCLSNAVLVYKYQTYYNILDINKLRTIMQNDETHEEKSALDSDLTI